METKKTDLKITLMDRLNLVLGFSANTFKANFFSNMQYLLREKNKSNDVKIISKNNHFTLSNQIVEIYNNALIRKAGKWEIQVEATLTDDVNTIIRSNIITVEVQYPHVDNIKSDPTVINHTETTWTNTKNAASAVSRQEFGFWIYYDTSNSSYVCGREVPGTVVNGCINTNGSVSLGVPNLNRPSMSPLQDGVYPVAGFHTHTPLTYCTGDVARIPVGPSPSDESWAIKNKIPGLVFDYKGGYLDNGIDKGTGIRSGHNINDSSKIYTFGPNRVKTPEL